MSHILRRLASWFGFPLTAGFSLTTMYPYPALDITLPQQRYLHLVASIHMGTAAMEPLPPQLLAKLAQADALIVEADISNNSSPFGTPEPQLPLAERLSAACYQQLITLCAQLSVNIEYLARLPTWQVALTLQVHQAQQLGLRANYGIDYQMIIAAHQQQKTVIELEGAQQQLALLQQLPQGGLLLLEDTLTHWHTNARLLQMMISHWLDNQKTPFTTELPTTFSDALYQVLMHQRNRRWQQQLLALPAGHYVVAVGALHIYGTENLPTLLQAAC